MQAAVESVKAGDSNGEAQPTEDGTDSQPNHPDKPRPSWQAAFDAAVEVQDYTTAFGLGPGLPFESETNSATDEQRQEEMNYIRASLTPILGKKLMDREEPVEDLQRAIGKPEGQVDGDWGQLSVDSFNARVKELKGEGDSDPAFNQANIELVLDNLRE